MRIQNSFGITSYMMGKSSAALGYGKNVSTDDRSGEKGIRISTGQNGAKVTRKEKSGEGTAVPKSMREQMREIAKNAEQGNHIQQGPVQYKGTSANSVLSGTLNYGDAIRQQRLKNADTSRQLKKVKYQFKNLSSKIMQSKTSVSARKVAGQAKREVIRLKKALNSEKYDKEDIEAAIAHAKVMERVAKKKARHLEEEEMVRAGGSHCAEKLEEERENLQDEDLQDEELQEELEEVSGEEMSPEEELTAEEMELMQEMEEMQESMDLEEVFREMEDFQEDMEEGMREMLEEMGLGDLEDTAHGVQKDMDPEELKVLKIKHRNKEMKDIVKADADYLKTVFKHYEEMKGSGGGAVPQAAAPAMGMQGGAMPSMPTINVTL